MELNFCLKRDELKDALKCFAPFIKTPRMVSEEDIFDEDGLIMPPKPYFDDKVTFLFEKGQLYLYVFVDEIKLERTCSSITSSNDVSFCLPLAYLLQEVERSKCESLEFVEDRFSGFIVNDARTKKHLFDIDAYSVRLQNAPWNFHDAMAAPLEFSLERFLLLKALVSLDKYTHRDPIHKYNEYIWFLIEEGYCTIFATNGSLLHAERYPVNTKGVYVFAIPGAYAVRIYNIISQWEYSPEYSFEYDGIYCRLSCHSSQAEHTESLGVPSHLDFVPNVKGILKERIVNHKATMKTADLRSTLSIIRAMDGFGDKLIMHFKGDHVNLFWKDKYEDKSVFEFKDVSDCDEDFVVALNVKSLDLLLNEIKTENVVLYFLKNNKLNILSENETLLGDTARILVTSVLLDSKDQEVLEEGEDTLNNNQRYLDKYYPKEEDEEDGDDECEYQQASIEEMREEAILRMKAISLYPEIIRYFEEEGEPQVYEPPLGAGYALEEDELEELHQTESARGILIWGVIRLFTKFNREDVTIDHYLFVSGNKADWDQERHDLYEGMPFVYTTMKEFPVKDYGHINIYMSNGGTPLRE